MYNLPLISIIIPAYNHEQYVQEAIQSAINQTYQNIELIVIDDGSKDNTWQKIDEMKSICQKRFSEIIFNTQSNQGVCLTLNKGISLATGQYIFLLASDDVASANALETLYNEIKTGKYILVVGDNEFIDGNSQKICWDKKCNPIPYDNNGYKTFSSYLQSKKHAVDFLSDEFGSYDSLLKGNYIPNGFLIVRDEFIKTGGYTDMAPLEDWYINLQLAKQGKFKFINKPLLYYRWHGTNSITQKQKMQNYARQTIKYELEQVESKNDIEAIIKVKKVIENRKTIFILPFIINIYKVKDFDKKLLVLEIVNKKFILKSKKIS